MLGIGDTDNNNPWSPGADLSGEEGQTRKFSLSDGERALERNKAGRQDWDHGGMALLCMIRGGLTEKVVLELSPKEGAMWTSGEEPSLPGRGSGQCKGPEVGVFWGMIRDHRRPV